VCLAQALVADNIPGERKIQVRRLVVADAMTVTKFSI
jgi:hypothetical protein